MLAIRKNIPKPFASTARNPKPETRNPKPETRNPTPFPTKRRNDKIYEAEGEAFDCGKLKTEN